MSYQETVLKTLRSIGCEPEREENVGYSFKYEMLVILYLPDVSDENILHFVLPNIFSVTEVNKDAVLRAMYEVTSSMKHVRFTIIGNTSLSVTYEHYLVSEENLEEVLRHMVKAVSHASYEFTKVINGEK